MKSLAEVTRLLAQGGAAPQCEAPGHEHPADVIVEQGWRCVEAARWGDEYPPSPSSPEPWPLEAPGLLAERVERAAAPLFFAAIGFLFDVPVALLHAEPSPPGPGPSGSGASSGASA